MSYTARTTGGKVVTFTFRGPVSDAAFIRVNGKTVSGHVHYWSGDGYGGYVFHPTGKNKGLVK